MKKAVVALGIVSLLLIGALLLAPKVVDWNAYRPEITDAVKRLTGYEVAIGGTVGFAILPQPALTATDIHVVARNEDSENFRAQTVALEIAIGPLLAGEVRFKTLRLLSPTLAVFRTSDGRLRWSNKPDKDAPEHFAAIGRPRLSLDDIGIENGTLIFHDLGRGRKFRFEAIELNASAKAWRGPYSAAGRFRVAKHNLRFDLKLGRRGDDNGFAVSRLVLALAGGEGELAFSGRFADDTTGGKLIGRLSAKAPDLAKLISALSGRAATPFIPTTGLLAEAKLNLTGDEAGLDDVTIRVAGSRLSGTIKARFRDPVHLQAKLATRRLDLDALLATVQAQVFTAGGLFHAVGRLVSSSPLPNGLIGGIDFEADGATLKGGVLRQMRLATAFENGKLRVENATMLLPGSSQFVLSGSGNAAAGASEFQGRLEFASDNLRRLIRWLGGALPDLPANRLANLSFTSGFRITPDLLEATDIDLRLDASNVTAGLSYRLQERPSFGLDAAIDRLDLDAYSPVLSSWAQAHRDDNGNESRLAILNAFDGNVKLRAGHITHGGRPAKDLSLEMTLLGGDLAISELQVRDFAGTKLKLSANTFDLATTPVYDGVASLRISDMAALAEALPFELPVPGLDAGAASFEINFSGRGDQADFDATGTLLGGETTLSGTFSGLVAAPHFDSIAVFSHPDASALWQWAGLQRGATVAEKVPISIRASLIGDRQTVRIDLQSTLAGGDVVVEGVVRPAEDLPSVDLSIMAAHNDVAALTRRLGLASESSERAGAHLALSSRVTGTKQDLNFENVRLQIGDATVTGMGSFRRANGRGHVDAKLQAGNIDLTAILAVLPSFSPEPPQGLQRARRGEQPADLSLGLDLTVANAAYRGIVLHQAHCRVRFERGVLTLDDLEAKVFGGRINVGGRLVTGEPAALNFEAKLTDAGLAAVSNNLVGLPVLEGSLSLTAAFQGLAANLSDLMQGIDGHIDMVAENGRITGMDLNGFDGLERPASDLTAVSVAVENLFRGGETKFIKAEGRWSVRGGVAHTDDTRILLPSGEIQVSGDFDFNRRHVDLRNRVRMLALKDAPAITVDLEGTGGAFKLGIRADAFARYLVRRGGVNGSGTSTPARR